MATTFRVDLTGSQGFVSGGLVSGTPVSGETSPNTSMATGFGTLTWDAAANTLSYDFTVKGLNFNQVTGMQFYSGAAGMTGPLAFGQLNPPQDTGTQLNPTQDKGDFTTIIMNPDGSWEVKGVWDLTDPASIPITNFAPVLSSATPPPAGSSTVGSPVPLYWNVSTITFPDGEIRGQLVPTP